MRIEQKAWSPLWLEFSGLPQLLNQKIRGGAGWPLFKKIVELDCAVNHSPGLVEVSLAELALRCGLSTAAVRRGLLAMRKLKIVSSFLPDHDEECALLRVCVPLSTPRTTDEIRAEHPELFGDRKHYFRYAVSSDSAQEQTDEEDDPILQEIVDLYLNTVGLKMNAFILDELRLVRTRFPIELIRRTFRRARQNDIHSLSWIVREMIRKKRGQDEIEGED